jgi:hypothetical protein
MHYGATNKSQYMWEMGELNFAEIYVPIEKLEPRQTSVGTENAIQELQVGRERGERRTGEGIESALTTRSGGLPTRASFFLMEVKWSL